MCPDQESNWWPFSSQACSQSTELHQPMQQAFFLLRHMTLNIWLTPSLVLSLPYHRGLWDPMGIRWDRGHEKHSVNVKWGPRERRKNSKWEQGCHDRHSEEVGALVAEATPCHPDTHRKVPKPMSAHAWPHNCPHPEPRTVLTAQMITGRHSISLPAWTQLCTSSSVPLSICLPRRFQIQNLPLSESEIFFSYNNSFIPQRRRQAQGC